MSSSSPDPPSSPDIHHRSLMHYPGSVRINVQGAFIVDDDDETQSPTPTSTPTPTPSRAGTKTNATKDIRLPNHTAVVSHVAVDIGGSLAKLVYFSREPGSAEPGGRLTFVSFETERINDCIGFIAHIKDHQQPLNGSRPGELCVVATGGGAYKYYDKMRQELGVDVLREDEMECLIMGLDFFITQIPREVFTHSETDPMHFVPSVTGAGADDADPGTYPYLVVNIGSGVSFLKVLARGRYERVGGTSLGGGTLWGLLSLLSGARSFDEMLEMAARGDNSKVDMLVGDIYGSDYSKVGLKSTTIASSFGKVFRRRGYSDAGDGGGVANGQSISGGGGSGDSCNSGQNGPDDDGKSTSHALTTNGRSQGGGSEEGGPSRSSAPATTTTIDNPPPSPDTHRLLPRASVTGTSTTGDRFSAADISRSLLFAISNNIGQIAFLVSQIHNLNHIYFGGSFIRGQPQTMNTLSYAIKFWSEGSKQAYFLRHEGYLGAVGAFLKRQPSGWGRRGSFEG